MSRHLVRLKRNDGVRGSHLTNLMKSIPGHVIELADELHSVLWQLMRHIRKQGESDPCGLSLLQKRLLSRIERCPGVGVYALARQEKLFGAVVSRHVQALEQAGLVQRTPSTIDRRRVGLSLTGQGGEVLGGIRRRRRDWLAGELAGLPDEGICALRQAIVCLKSVGDGE